MVDEVFAWWLADPQAPRLIGSATFVPATRGTIFRYHPDWVAAGVPLSGDMPLDRQVVTAGGALPGALSDALPDRWGRRVIAATERSARQVDFDLLYLAGDSRFGALGFSLSSTRYEPPSAGPVLQVSSLEQMAELAQRIDTRSPLSEEEKRIVATGRTMGGAQPKVLITDGGIEWIAKFSRGQVIDAGLVEHATTRLARAAGITVNETRAHRLADGHAFLVRRFDRAPGQRIHALSANTALMHGVHPDQPPEAELSYPALASLLRLIAPDAATMKAQQRELFRRMAFNVLIANTDDHERNHALIRVEGHWSMSPAYDLLPSASGDPRSAMGLGALGTEATLENVFSQVPHFGLSLAEAVEEWLEVVSIVSDWKRHFEEAGVAGVDIDYLAGFVDAEHLVALRDTAAIRARTRAMRPKQTR